MIRARAADWWRTTSVGDGITLIDEPHIKPFYRCNCWHIRGEDEDLLVDSGMGVVPMRQWVSLVTERPLTAVASWPCSATSRRCRASIRPNAAAAAGRGSNRRGAVATAWPARNACQSPPLPARVSSR